jgi:predicted transcriptional regulator
MDKDLKIILMEILKAKGISVPRFANAIGIPKDRIYKWYQQGSSPKPEDALKIEDWIKKSNITQGSLQSNTRQ